VQIDQSLVVQELQADRVSSSRVQLSLRVADEAAERQSSLIRASTESQQHLVSEEAQWPAGILLQKLFVGPLAPPDLPLARAYLSSPSLARVRLPRANPQIYASHPRKRCASQRIYVKQLARLRHSGGGPGTCGPIGSI